MNECRLALPSEIYQRLADFEGEDQSAEAFEEIDLYSQWLAARCDLGADKACRGSYLFASFRLWAEDQYEYAGTATAFNQALLKRGFERCYRHYQGGSRKSFKGLTLI